MLRKQLTEQLVRALEANNLTQADLARMTGLTPKHVNHLVNGNAGSIGVFDFAAVVLGMRWEVRLTEDTHSPCA